MMDVSPTGGAARSISEMVIVMTSNLGSDIIQDMADDDYDDMKREVMRCCRKLPARVHQPD